MPSSTSSESEARPVKSSRSIPFSRERIAALEGGSYRGREGGREGGRAGLSEHVVEFRGNLPSYFLPPSLPPSLPSPPPSPSLPPVLPAYIRTVRDRQGAQAPPSFPPFL